MGEFDIDWEPFRVMTVVEATRGELIKQGLYVITDSSVTERTSLIRKLGRSRLSLAYIECQVDIEMMEASAFDDMEIGDVGWGLPNAFDGYFHINGLGYFIQSIEQRLSTSFHHSMYPEIHATMTRVPSKDVRTQEA